MNQYTDVTNEFWPLIFAVKSLSFEQVTQMKQYEIIGGVVSDQLPVRVSRTSLGLRIDSCRWLAKNDPGSVRYDDGSDQLLCSAFEVLLHKLPEAFAYQKDQSTASLIRDSISRMHTVARVHDAAEELADMMLRS